MGVITKHFYSSLLQHSKHPSPLNLDYYTFRHFLHYLHLHTYMYHLLSQLMIRQKRMLHLPYVMLRIVMTSLGPSLLHTAWTTVFIPVLALGTSTRPAGSQSTLAHKHTHTHPQPSHGKIQVNETILESRYIYKQENVNKGWKKTCTAFLRIVLVFPLWMATEILCRRYCFELASSVVVLRCQPKSSMNLRDYGPKMPDVSTATGINMLVESRCEYWEILCCCDFFATTPTPVTATPMLDEA